MISELFHTARPLSNRRTEWRGFAPSRPARGTAPVQNDVRPDRSRCATWHTFGATPARCAARCFEGGPPRRGVDARVHTGAADEQMNAVGAIGVATTALGGSPSSAGAGLRSPLCAKARAAATPAPPATWRSGSRSWGRSCSRWECRSRCSGGARSRPPRRAPPYPRVGWPSRSERATRTHDARRQLHDRTDAVGEGDPRARRPELGGNRRAGEDGAAYPRRADGSARARRKRRVGPRRRSGGAQLRHMRRSSLWRSESRRCSCTNAP